MNIAAKSIAKFLLYLAPLSVLIVASSMFFPFIVGKAIFFRTVITLATLAYAAHYLFWITEEEKEDVKAIIRNPIFLSLVTFTLLFLLASFTAVNPHFAFWANFERGEGGLQMIFYAIFFVLAVLILKTKKEWLSFITWLIPIGVLVSLYAIGQRLNFFYVQNLQNIATATGKAVDQTALQNNPWSQFFGAGDRISGTLGNPLYISTFIIFMIFFIMLLFSEYARSKTAKIILSIVAIFQIYVFFLAQSRNGLSGVLAGIVTFMLVMTFTKEKRHVWASLSLRSVALSTLCALIIGGSLFYTTRTASVCDAYGQSALTKTCVNLAKGWTKIPIVNRFAKERILAGLDDRTWTWGTALSGFIEKPILGWGPENFPIVFDRYYNPNHFGGDSWFDRAHDTYLEYLVDGGIILLLAYLSIWVFYFREIYQKRARMSVTTLGLMSAFPVAYLIQAISAFEVLPIFLLLYTFLAFAIRFHYGSEEIKKKTDRQPLSRTAKISNGLPQMAALTGLCALSAITLYYANYLPLEKNRLLLIVAASGGGQDQKVIYDRFIKTLDYDSPIGQQETVQYFLLFVFRFLDNNASSQNLADKKEDLLRLVQKADAVFYENEKTGHSAVGVKSLSYLGQIHLKAAIILKDSAMLNSAQNIFEHGLELAPTRFEFIYPLLDIAALKKDSVMAKPLLSLAKNLRPDLPQNTAYEQIFSTTSTTSTSSTTNK